MPARRIVIAGGSLGGLRTAEQLRAAGWDGEITIVEAEPHMPYNRPPLSKQALAAPEPAGEADLARATALPLRAAAAGIDWRLGRTIVGAQLADRVVALDDGSRLDFAGLVVATGLRPRRLPFGPAHAARHVLRTAADAARLRRQLTPGARLVVVGGGFIGCEVAATARGMGCEVTVVEPLALPMLLPLGAALADRIRQVHEDRGIAFRLGRAVRALHARSVDLDDGTSLEYDVLVEAIGARPNVEWLAHNGLELSDGVLCDESMRVEGRRGVVGVGDVARHPCGLLGGRPIRIEHWAVPTDTARRAARTLVGDLTGRPIASAPRPQVPSFWSDQGDLRIQGLGVSAAGESFAVLEGSLEDLSVAIGAHLDGRLVGVVTVGLPPARLAAYRRLLLDDVTQDSAALSAA